MELVDRLHSTFTKRELERLTAYRAAVAAGFYTDWTAGAERVDQEALASLGDLPRVEAGARPEQPAC